MNISWIDILFIVILLVCLIQGIVKGFVKSVISFGIVIVAIISSKIFTPNMVFFIKTKTNLYTKLTSTITDKVLLVFGGNATSSAITDSSNLNNIPNGLLRFLQSFVDSTNNTVGSTAEAFGQNAANVIVNIIAFMLIFLFVIIIGKLILLLLDKIMELPGLRIINRLGGMALGALKGIVFVMIIATIIYSLNVFLQVDGLANAINNSVLIKYFYMSFLFK